MKIVELFLSLGSTPYNVKLGQPFKIVNIVPVNMTHVKLILAVDPESPPSPCFFLLARPGDDVKGALLGNDRNRLSVWSDCWSSGAAAAAAMKYETAPPLAASVA